VLTSGARFLEEDDLPGRHETLKLSCDKLEAYPPASQPCPFHTEPVKEDDFPGRRQTARHQCDKLESYPPHERHFLGSYYQDGVFKVKGKKAGRNGVKHFGLSMVSAMRRSCDYGLRATSAQENAGFRICA
jgi:hypothetical protein